MLLNAPKDIPEVHKQKGLRYLAIPVAGILLAESFYVLSRVPLIRPPAPENADRAVGTIWSISTGLFTDYLLPFEVTSILILMAIVGAMVLARRETDREGG
jgi:NADH:ubiquinone oxidoreductase subunit 6 (subunit J)